MIFQIEKHFHASGTSGVYLNKDEPLQYKLQNLQKLQDKLVNYTHLYMTRSTFRERLTKKKNIHLQSAEKQILVLSAKILKIDI